MPKRLLTAVTAVLAVLALAAPAAAEAHAPGRAVMDDCTRGSDEADRAVVFEGHMRTVKGAARMQMRFTLQARTPDRQKWTAVAAPGFGAWVTADPGTARYVYTKRVESLLAPGAYRAVVRFRWLRADGSTRASWRDASRPCRQPDPRPNLELRAITVEAGRYLVTVANTGRGIAGPFAVALTVAGELQPLVGGAGLERGEETVVELSGPACAPGAQVVAEVDPDAAIDEAGEADNVLSRFC